MRQKKLKAQHFYQNPQQNCSAVCFFTKQISPIILSSHLGGIGVRISIDITAREVDVLVNFSENAEIGSFIDKVLREAEKVSSENITEAMAIQEVNPYSSREN